MNPNITAEIYAQMLDTCAKDMQGDIDRLMLAKYRNNMGHSNYKLTDEQKRELDRITDSFMEHTNYKLTDEPLSFATEEELDKAQIKAENLEIELEN